jgi:hypothetical protein
MAVARGQALAVEGGGDRVVGADTGQHLHGVDEIARGIGDLLPRTLARDAERAVEASLPVKDQRDLVCLGVEVDDDLLEQGPHDPLPNGGVGLRMVPEPLEVTREGERIERVLAITTK